MISPFLTNPEILPDNVIGFTEWFWFDYLVVDSELAFYVEAEALDSGGQVDYVLGLEVGLENYHGASLKPVGFGVRKKAIFGK